jgi:hypothetical protein
MDSSFFRDTCISDDLGPTDGVERVEPSLSHDRIYNNCP